MSRVTANRIPTLRRTTGFASAVVVLSCLLAACGEEPRPRTFADFTEDRIAREGTLARCNANREATLHDIECANARRAQSAIALRRERERREELERESQRRIAALTQQMAERERIAREELLAAERAAIEAYEALWSQQRGSAGAGIPNPPPAADESTQSGAAEIVDAGDAETGAERSGG